MRPAEYGEEQIIEAGEQLQADGRRVTGFALRKVVGGGNPSRLVSVWQEHLRRQEVVDAEPVQELPVEVEDALNEMTSSFLEQVRALAVNLNTRAVKTAERRVADVMHSAQEQQAAAEAELVDAAAAVDDLESRLQAEQETRDAAEAERDQVRAEVTELRQALAVQAEKFTGEQEQRQAAEAKIRDLAGQLEELKNDKQDLRRERDQALAKIQKQDQTMADLQAERNNLVDARGELKAQLATLAEREEATLRRLEQATAERDQAMTEATAARQRLDQAEARAEQLQQQYADLLDRTAGPGPLHPKE